MDEKKELLEEVLALSGCLYISDLREYFTSHHFGTALDLVPKEKYSSEEWQSAVSYITGMTIHGGTEEELRKLLKVQVD